MKKLVSLLLLSAAPSLIAQKLTQDDLNVYVTRTSAIFAKNVPTLDGMDLRNSRAIHIEPDGRPGGWQELKRGRGRTDYGARSGIYEGGTSAELGWSYMLDQEHMVVDYDWVEWYGSSRQWSDVQIFKWRDGKVFIRQQIEADTHGGGDIAGAWFNPKTKRLTVKAVELDSPKGRCCPTHLNVVVYLWDGGKFRQISAHQIPMPRKK